MKQLRNIVPQAVGKDEKAAETTFGTGQDVVGYGKKVPAFAGDVGIRPSSR